MKLLLEESLKKSLILAIKLELDLNKLSSIVLTKEANSLIATIFPKFVRAALFQKNRKVSKFITKKIPIAAHPRQGIPGPSGPVRLRQDHHDAHDRGVGGADLGRDLDRRPGGQ